MRLTTKQVIISFFCLISFFHASVLIAQTTKLKDFIYIGEFSKEQAKLVLKNVPPLNSLEVKYSLNLYKIHYQTKAPNGDKTIASGLVAMPQQPVHRVAIVSFQHGTRVLREDVPSNNNEKNYIYPAIFGNSGGYMVVMPDYLGLGDNRLPLHPYVQSESLASSCIDMLIAAKELANIINYPINETLFLAGYSEGGFSTLVMYEALLKNYKEIPVTAAAPGSAPYDWNETMQFLTQDPGPRATAYFAYFFYSMQTYYHYWNGMNEIFKKPYDTLIPLLFDGTHQLPDILQSLPLDPHEIMQEPFFTSLMNGTVAHADDLMKNLNHYHFKSTSPLLLVGTRGDRDVPYHGAEIAYQQLKSQSDAVYIKQVSDVLDHVEAAPLVLKEQLEFFKRFDTTS